MSFIMDHQLENAVLKDHKVGGFSNLNVLAWHDVVCTQGWICLLPSLCGQ